MKYLLDTHALIWFMNGDNSISTTARNKIKNESNSCIVSIASIWEIAIKSNLGKLEIKVDFNEIAERNAEVFNFLIENQQLRSEFMHD